VLEATRRLGRSGEPPSVKAVATAAGVSRTTVYRLFGSRRELLAQAGFEPDRESREAVLEAAAALVQTRGLHGFTFEDLAAAAGVSRATVYRLFPGRPALLKGLLERFSPLEPVLAALDRLSDRPAGEVMPELARTAARVADRNRGLLLSLAGGLAQLDPEVLEALRGGIERVSAAAVPYLAGQVRAGRLRPVHPVLALQAFVGPLVIHVLSRPALDALPLPGGLPSIEEAATELAGSWLRAHAR
jgi:AcrR family transcriptional regulator